MDYKNGHFATNNTNMNATPILIKNTFFFEVGERMFQVVYDYKRNTISVWSDNELLFKRDDYKYPITKKNTEDDALVYLCKNI